MTTLKELDKAATSSGLNCLYGVNVHKGTYIPVLGAFVSIGAAVYAGALAYKTASIYANCEKQIEESEAAKFTGISDKTALPLLAKKIKACKIVVFYNLLNIVTLGFAGYLYTKE